MEIEINGQFPSIIIQRKKNKNTYIRVNETLDIVVTTSAFVSNKQIYKMIEENYLSIEKMLERQKKENEKADNFYYFGKKYDIIIMSTLENVEMSNGYIYAKSKTVLEKWYQKEMKRVFEEHVKKEYQKFEEDIPFPKIKIRKMKTRWGVCNKKDTSITLNANLMKESLACLDYVIVHELSHFVHFDHSKAFWKTVEKYCKNYKELRKQLKE